MKCMPPIKKIARPRFINAGRTADGKAGGRMRTKSWAKQFYPSKHGLSQIFSLSQNDIGCKRSIGTHVLAVCLVALLLVCRLADPPGYHGKVLLRTHSRSTQQLLSKTDYYYQSPKLGHQCSSGSSNEIPTCRSTHAVHYKFNKHMVPFRLKAFLRQC